MGGIGSGTWYRLDTKVTVEQSLSLSMQDFRGQVYSGSSGHFSWTMVGGSEFSVGYRVISAERPTITLRYCLLDGDNIEIPVRLQTTPTNFKGRRWWLTCPLTVGGVACNRRAGKLYFPPGAKHFGCRECHDLSYRSSQEAHRAERLPGRIERMEALTR